MKVLKKILTYKNSILCWLAVDMEWLTKENISNLINKYFTISTNIYYYDFTIDNNYFIIYYYLIITFFKSH